MKQQMQAISIIVPTLNEAGNLPLLFKRIHASLKHASIPYEIIVVDDHSTDGTDEVALTARAKYNVSLLEKQGKPGKAFSLLEGFAAAQHELVCMIDGDLQYPPEAIKHMYHKLQYCEADIVVTDRVNNQTGLLRRLMSSTFNLVFTRALFGINYDTQSGLKLFRKSILKTLTIEPSPWTFDLEFIVKALEQNYVIVSQEIEFGRRNSGVPKVHIVAATLEIAASSLRLRRNTAGRRVKSSYRNSELMQRSTHSAIAVLFAATVMAGIGLSGSSASALSLPDVHLPGTSNTKPSDDDTTDDTDKVTTPVTTTPVTTTVNSATATPSTTSSASNPTVATSSNSSTAQTVPKTSTSTASSNTKSTAQQTNAASNDPDSLQTSAGKNAKYYPASKLSSSKTQSLLKLAATIVLAGIGLIGLGALIMGFKALIARMRQPVRI